MIYDPHNRHVINAIVNLETTFLFGHPKQLKLLDPFLHLSIYEATSSVSSRNTPLDNSHLKIYNA